MVKENGPRHTRFKGSSMITEMNSRLFIVHPFPASFVVFSSNFELREAPNA